MLTTRFITSEAELHSLKTAWNELADGEPMYSSNWLATWWKHYGPTKIGDDQAANRELRVVAVFERNADEVEKLIGIAPWYLDRTLVKGNVLCPLGDGEVCTDHQSLICAASDTSRVAKAVADFLIAENEEWDRLELPAVDVGDFGIDQLTRELESHECMTTRYAAGNTWIVDLPKTWDEYLTSIPKNNRRQIRKVCERFVESGAAKWHVATSTSDFEAVWKEFVDLHQRRRKSLGEPGCFASLPFQEFHHELAQLLLANGQLRMSWVEVDGSPLAAEYQFAGRATNYMYQSGLDPERTKVSPGHLVNAHAIRRTIEEGRAHFDFMRGDETYKSFWLATARPTFDCVVVPNRRIAQLRGRLTHAAKTLKSWVKEGVEIVSN